MSFEISQSLTDKSMKFVPDSGGMIHQSVTDELAAFKDWENLPEEHRRRVLENVYCGQCRGSVKVVDYNVTFEGISLVLRGKCKKCGHEVARMLEGL